VWTALLREKYRSETGYERPAVRKMAEKEEKPTCKKTDEVNPRRKKGREGNDLTQRKKDELAKFVGGEGRYSERATTGSNTLTPGAKIRRGHDGRNQSFFALRGRNRERRGSPT